MEKPTTFRPERASRQAATELSTPPLIATAVAPFSAVIPCARKTVTLATGTGGVKRRNRPL